MRRVYFINKWLKGTAYAALCSKFSFISLFLGAFALTISISVLEGFHHKIKEIAFKYDAQLKLNSYENRSFLYSEMIKREIENQIGIFNSYQILETQSLVKLGKDTELLSIKSVDKEYFESILGLNSEIENNSVVLSNQIKKKYKLAIGDEIVLFYRDFSEPNSRTKVKQFYIKDFFSFGFAEIDENLLLANIDGIRDLAGIDSNFVTSIEFRNLQRSISSTDLGSLNGSLGYPYYFQRAEDIHFVKLAWIEVQKQPIPIVLALITLIAVSNIISSMLVMLIEKYKEIGILRALGMRKSSLMYTFAVRGFFLGLWASVFGVTIAIIVGLGLSEFELINLPSDIYFVNKLPIKLEPSILLLIIGISSIFSMLVSIVPGYIATRMKPIKALRFIE